MTKKNILFMTQLPPPVHGAALRNKSLLESKLINSNFAIYSLPLKFVDDMKELEKFSFKKIFLMIRYALRLCYLLSTKKIDLVYFTMTPSGVAFYRDIVFLSLIKVFRKKRILHFRRKGIRKTATSTFGRRLIKYAFQGSNIVCLSKHHTTDIGAVSGGNIHIVPNGIKIETEFLHLTNKEKVVGSVPSILFLSNLSEKKGVLDLIKALGILKQQGYKFKANLVGSEWDLSFSDVENSLNREGLTEQVFIVGPKYGKDKFTYISNSDIFVFPTYFELFPGVILEAMQFGKAIVSTFEGSIPEIIDDQVNGILVTPRDPVKLAEAVARFLSNPEIVLPMGELARQKFFREFTLEVFEMRMNTLFEKIINE